MCYCVVFDVFVLKKVLLMLCTCQGSRIFQDTDVRPSYSAAVCDLLLSFANITVRLVASRVSRFDEVRRRSILIAVRNKQTYAYQTNVEQLSFL